MRWLYAIRFKRKINIWTNFREDGKIKWKSTESGAISTKYKSNLQRKPLCPLKPLISIRNPNLYTLKIWTNASIPQKSHGAKIMQHNKRFLSAIVSNKWQFIFFCLQNMFDLVQADLIERLSCWLSSAKIFDGIQKASVNLFPFLSDCFHIMSPFRPFDSLANVRFDPSNWPMNQKLWLTWLQRLSFC